MSKTKAEVLKVETERQCHTCTIWVDSPTAKFSFCWYGYSPPSNKVCAHRIEKETK